VEQIATSNGRSLKSLSPVTVQRFNSTSETLAKNRPSFGISQSEATEGDAATESLRCRLRRLSVSNADSSLLKPSDSS
jgi:hypothetical protein